MIHTFYNKKISSVLSVLPSKKVDYLDEIVDYPFPENQSRKLGKMMDYNTKRICEWDEGISDYALQGIQYLLKNKVLSKEEIGAIVVSTSSQDYIIPPVSFILQGKLDLGKDVLCFDIAQACGGYVMGLIQSFMLLDTYKLKKVILVTGDFLSKKVGKRDRNSRPILGDAVNVSIVENSDKDNEILTIFKNYGESASVISIPAGGLKHPSTAETAIETQDETGNYRALDHFFMDGEEVFNFVMIEVPPIIKEIITHAGKTLEDIDYYMFHQPNQYMLHKLADELDIPYEKMFSNIVGIYGNPSTASIPLNICHNIRDIITRKELSLCLSGFGGGLTANAMLLTTEKMDLCEIIDYRK
ncbi:MAG TPA: ketoacyl-ACP synthase III [Bacteroidales bacterium]|nr:ketoacyl-ACP synthase III [Bacteroidales bacterium]